jgi:hypothetical protein
MGQYVNQFKAEKMSLERLLNAAQEELAELLVKRHSVDQEILMQSGM